MKLTPELESKINTLDEDVYQYRLISAQPVYLDEREIGSLIIRGLIMDGESLLKRFKAQFNKSIRPK